MGLEIFVASFECYHSGLLSKALKSLPKRSWTNHRIIRHDSYFILYPEINIRLYWT